jgi:DNA-directed RNA polymerase specialized sigma24 family protein
MPAPFLLAVCRKRVILFSMPPLRTPERAADTAEFKHLLDDLYPRWNAFLWRSYSSLKNVHADLVQQSAEDLTRYARERSWSEVDDWSAMGFRILHRRIADHYRSQARAWTFEPISEDLPAADSATNPERVAHYAAQLQKLVRLITGLDDQDRHLLLSEILDDGPNDRSPLTDVERKRMSRLRARLRDKMESREGDTEAGKKK